MALDETLNLRPMQTQSVAPMPSPDRSGYVLCNSRSGFHKIAYVEWGDPRSKRVVVCAHGLSRQGRDFDWIASALASDGWRVVCPDLVGRGRSEWLRDEDDYALPQYARDLTTLIARLGVDTVDWIGTSLGGLIGMVLAGQPGSPIGRLVVNDIGPFLPWQALHRLGTAVRNAPRAYPNLGAATQFYRTALAPFGALSDAQWLHIARHSVTETGNGTYRTLCDPNIIAAFRTTFFFNLSLWTYYDAIRCPTLVLRGVTSDLLSPSTVQDMVRRGPKVAAVEFPDCGHAPALMDPHQIETIIEWFRATPIALGSGHRTTGSPIVQPGAPEANSE